LFALKDSVGIIKLLLVIKLIQGLSFLFILSVRKGFLHSQQRCSVTVGDMNLKLIIFSCFLFLVGLALFFYGTSLSNQVMNPESLISGTFYVVVGIFLGIAGFLMLILHLFQRQSLSY
jgi:hypothetical protein